MRSYVAEFIGTFGLTLAVGISLAGVFPVATPVVAALTVGIFVYTVGHISGTHINPAITVAAWSLGKMRFASAAYYVAAQFLGAAAARFLMGILVTPLPLKTYETFGVGVAEFLGTLFLAFGVAAVILGKVASPLQGVVIGGSLFFGVAIASSLSNGIINPAVAFGIGSFSFVYFFGPMLGAIAGMWLYRWLLEE